MRQRVALAGLTGGVSLLGMYYWWRHRHDGSGVGYVNGKPITLTLVTVDGKPVEVSTAAAFAQLRAAARAHGVNLRVVSGFRTFDEQEHLHQCFLTGRRNNGNFAQPPGYSSHQSGRALDLTVRADGTLSWLRENARLFHFYETVPDEPWHWEWLPPTPV